jgi:starch-binding outer membrane protein, SusD/RagB family
VMLFFREKAFWQFGRGNRLGDLRRLVRVYGKGTEDVMPTGRFHKAGGASYGVDITLPITDNEKQNPNFKGCIDRKA